MTPCPTCGHAYARLQWPAGVEYDQERRRLTVDGELVSMSRREAEVFDALVDAGGGWLSRDELRTQTWGEAALWNVDVLRGAVYRLRKRLRQAGLADLIDTTWTRGYRLRVRRFDSEISLSERERTAHAS